MTSRPRTGRVWGALAAGAVAGSLLAAAGTVISDFQAAPARSPAAPPLTSPVIAVAAAPPIRAAAAYRRVLGVVAVSPVAPAPRIPRPPGTPRPGSGTPNSAGKTGGGKTSGERERSSSSSSSGAWGVVGSTGSDDQPSRGGDTPNWFEKNVLGEYDPTDPEVVKENQDILDRQRDCAAKRHQALEDSKKANSPWMSEPDC